MLTMHIKISLIKINIVKNYIQVTLLNYQEMGRSEVERGGQRNKATVNYSTTHLLKI